MDDESFDLVGDTTVSEIPPEKQRLLNRVEQVKTSLKICKGELADAEAKTKELQANIAVHDGMLQALEFALEWYLNKL